MGAEERGNEGRIALKIRECKSIFDSMGGAEGAKTDTEYRDLFSQEPTKNYEQH